MRVVLFADRGFAVVYLFGSIVSFDIFIWLVILGEHGLPWHLISLFCCFVALYLAALDRVMRRRVTMGPNVEMRYLGDGTGIAAGPANIVAVALGGLSFAPDAERGPGAVRFRSGPSLLLRVCALLAGVGRPWMWMVDPQSYLSLVFQWFWPSCVLLVFYFLIAWRYRTLTISLDGLQLGRRHVPWDQVGKVSTVGQWLRVEVRGERSLWARLLPNGGPRQTADMAREVIEDGPGAFLPRPTLLSEKLWPEPPTYAEAEEESFVVDKRKSL